MNLQKLVKEQDKSRSKKEKGNVSLCHTLPLPLFFYRSKDLGWHLTVALRRLTEKELRNNGLHCPGSEFYYVMGSLFSVKGRVNSVSFNQTPVFLNIYDLTPANGYFYWAGLGIFHSGVEIYGVEYAFGAHDYPTSGVFESDPQKCPGFKFRRSILIGTTSLGPMEVREFIERLAKSYYGDTYHLFVKNCNHFCDDMCYKLTGKRIPKWVNRLARIGSLCLCILPQSVKVTAVGMKDSNFQDGRAGNKRPRTTSIGCLASISLCRKKALMSSLFLPSHYKICLPPHEMKRSKSKRRWLLKDMV